jgi:polysaccharide biosynthesis/export protein
LKSPRFTLLNCTALVMALLSLAGCGLTPGSGPSRGAILEGALGWPDEEATPAFALVEIDDQALDVLARRKPPTLRGFFGDYRPSAAQVIGVGDSLQITVWEAASGGSFLRGTAAM